LDLGRETVRVKLTAPPVEGEANHALIKFIARACRVPKKDVEIVSGGRSREKTILIRGLELSVIIDRLSRLSDSLPRMNATANKRE
jgi:uncharacterized protein (TIGR00251 family)